MKYTIAVGNISYGIDLYGLYDSEIEATENAIKGIHHLDWVVMNIGSQEDLNNL